MLRSKDRGAYRTFFFWATMILFLGSTFFHMSGTRIGKFADVGAMLVLSMGICTFSVHRWYRWTDRKAVLFFMTGLLISWTFLYLMSFGNVAFALEILIAAVLEYRMIREGRSLLIAKRVLWSCLFEFGAFIFLILDVTRTWCDPQNHIINGHAIWHLLSGTAIYIFFTAKRIQES